MDRILTPRIRALDADRRYWAAMFAASALGANLGDFCADALDRFRAGSFAGLMLAAGIAIAADRRLGPRSEAAYWTAIVLLRATATNFGDYLTHDLGLGYPACSAVLGALSIGAARLTVADPRRRGSPRIDAAYWAAMLVAGFFGTVCGDLVSHHTGLYASSALLSAVLMAAVALRSGLGPSSVLLYWCIVLAERCAGTAFGDLLASRRALGFGLPLAMACTGAMLLAALLARLPQSAAPGRLPSGDMDGAA